MNKQKSLVLIGSYNSGKTSGTGFIISYETKIYIVTCKHVIFGAGSKNLFAMPNIQMTKSPKDGYKVLSLKNIHFHPEDTNDLSYDVAVCEIDEKSMSEIELLNITCIPINNESDFTIPQNGDEIIGYGFPVIYAEQLFSLNKNEPMPPFKLKGKLLKIPIHDLTHIGFTGNLHEGYFAQTPKKPFSLSGLSGGLAISNNNSGKVCGVVLGNADIQLVLNSNITSYQGFIFASFNRVIEILNSIDK